MFTFQSLTKAAATFAIVAVILPAGQTALVAPPAVENSPVIVSLGQAVDPATGKIVEGMKIIHYKKGYGHKPNHPGSGGSGSTVCYAFLASGARWKTTEDYLFDPTNSRSLDPIVVRNLLSASLESWDGQTAFEIFGNEISGVVDGADSSSPDGKNEVLFGDAGSPGAIAVTTVWGVFRGPTSQRYLAEWDMVLDDLNFDWSVSGEAGKMDFQNIVTHEVGHAAGMGHPSDSCTEETMYRYADYGETKKRDLNGGDIQGLQKLYGA